MENSIIVVDQRERHVASKRSDIYAFVLALLTCVQWMATSTTKASL
jgi:hypothetical protein